jgi:methylated-DNA-[protein]-cysteine S-methyltransferase
MMYGIYFKTIIGQFGLLEADDKIVGVLLPGEKFPDGIEARETPLLLEGVRQIEAYLDGDLKEFTLPVSFKGTDFMKKVWKSLMDIPYGQTRCYKDIAEIVGNSKAARAVGMANNRNPLPIIIPCHRVIGKNGRMIGYRGGLSIKQQLLELERIVGENEK